MIRRFLLTLLIIVSLCGCKNNTISVSGVSFKESEFNGIYIQKTVEEFYNLGFTCGDSVNIIFSNDFRVDDVPFYSGYYTRTGIPLLTVYPGYTYPEFSYNNGPDVIETIKLTDDDTIKIELNKKGKYLDVENAMSVRASLVRDTYDSDETFGNFRPLVGGDIDSTLLYRSASPCVNTYNRASYVSELSRKYHINSFIDLSDNEEEIKNYYDDEDADISYWRSMYDKGNICCLDLSANYRNKDYKTKLVKGLRYITENDGPFLIHCVEGKDRTGFVCLLLEALCNASIEELEYDYMITYSNYYGIDKTNKSDMYKAYYDNRFADFLTYLTSKESLDDIKPLDVYNGAVDYLLSAGMSIEEINMLINKISGND